jgi:prophage maintenance system killer protein
MLCARRLNKAGEITKQVTGILHGNKRIAYAACDVFLRINGMVIRADPVELAQQLEQVAAHSGDL